MESYIKNIFRLIICAALLPVFCFAQKDTVYLNAGKVLELANAESFVIRKINHQNYLAEVEWAKSKEWWAPDVFIGTRLHQLNGSGLNTEGQIFTDIDRQSRWAGGELQANWNLAGGAFNAQSKKYLSESKRYNNQHEKNKLIIDMVNQYYMLVLHRGKELFLNNLIKEK